MPNEIEIFDRALLRHRRRRALAAGRPPEFLLERAVDDLMDRLTLVRRTFPIAVVLGASTGLLPIRLKDVAGIEMVVACEAEMQFLALSPQPKLLADEELLPFAPESIDLVVSALALQFVNDLPGTLSQIRRSLRPDGLLLASMLGGRTLHELREALLAAEAEAEGGASPRVAPFVDVRDLGGLLQRAGLALPVVDSDTVTVTYASPLRLLADLRAMGATNVLLARRRTPLRRTTLLRAMHIYERKFGVKGRVPATFEILTMSGWAPHASQQKPARRGSAKISLVEALAQRKGPDAGPGSQ